MKIKELNIPSVVKSFEEHKNIITRLHEIDSEMIISDIKNRIGIHLFASFRDRHYGTEVIITQGSDTIKYFHQY